MGTSDNGKAIAQEIMLEFAERTGLRPEGASHERYLWTDAFAVCNFLGLHRQTGEEQYRRLALLLVDQVHSALGRHRGDDGRTGWISGLGEEEGRRHPTRGGLRIGKRMRERRLEEPFDERLEWERDGQYFHYLTQWMHALGCVSRATGDPTCTTWAMELAKTAHSRFAYLTRKGTHKRLYWKMSIDLSYPLVSSMGHHDPLDGLVSYCELRAEAGRSTGQSQTPNLDGEIADMAAICEGKDWVTDDPLGIGGLLTAAYRMAQLIMSGDSVLQDFFDTVVEDSLRSLQYFDRTTLSLPPDYRLAFRELGLSIGLQAIRKMQDLVDEHPAVFGRGSAGSKTEDFSDHVQLAGEINSFWKERKHSESPAWEQHRNINMVMLATGLAPEGYLLGLV